MTLRRRIQASTVLASGLLVACTTTQPDSQEPWQDLSGIGDGLVNIGDGIPDITEEEKQLHQLLLDTAISQNRERMMELIAAGVDLTARDNDGYMFLQKLVMQSNIPAIRFALDCGVEVNIISKYGTTCLQRADQENQELLEFLLDAGAVSGVEIENNRLEALAALDRSVEQVLSDHGAILVPRRPYRESDFRVVPRNVSASPRDDHAEVTVIVIESKEVDHHQDTLYVAEGVRRMLGNNRQNATFGLRGAIVTGDGVGMWGADHSMNDATKILLRRSDVVFSYSVGEDHIRDNFMVRFRRTTDSEKREAFWEKWQPIIFHSSGNDQESDNFADSTPYTFSNRAVAVGSAEMEVSGDWHIPVYSEGSCVVLAPIVDKDGEKFSGTSFAAPHAAGLYAELAELYYERDLGFDEIMFAVCMTADKNIISETKGEINLDPQTIEDLFETISTPVFLTFNQAGLSFSDRSGFGVVNFVNAIQVLDRMVELKRGGGTVEESYQIEVVIDSTDPTILRYENSEHPREYQYEIVIPDDLGDSGIILNMMMDLKFPDEHHGPISLQGQDGVEIPLRVSVTGKDRLHEFKGVNISAGDRFILKTVVPLEQGSDCKFRCVDQESVIGRVRDENLSFAQDVLSRNEEILASMRRDIQDLEEQINTEFLGRNDDRLTLYEPSGELNEAKERFERVRQSGDTRGAFQAQMALQNLEYRELIGPLTTGELIRDKQGIMMAFINSRIESDYYAMNFLLDSGLVSEYTIEAVLQGAVDDENIGAIRILLGNGAEVSDAVIELVTEKGDLRILNIFRDHGVEIPETEREGKDESEQGRQDDDRQSSLPYRIPEYVLAPPFSDFRGYEGVHQFSYANLPGPGERIGRAINDWIGRDNKSQPGFALRERLRQTRARSQLVETPSRS